MFVRAKTFKNKDGQERTYLQLVESRREDGKVRQRVVANLGRLDQIGSDGVDRLIESLSQFAEKYHELQKVRSQAMGVQWAKAWGPALIFRHLWSSLGLKNIVARQLVGHKHEFPLDESIFAMVLNRLTDPGSKLQMTGWTKTVYRPEFEQLSLHHYYRALDFLADHKEGIENSLFNQVRDLFHADLSLVLWDTTSTYFEGPGPKGLAAFGHSKDSRPDRTQVVIGVLMTADGLPVAHEVFPGNTVDTASFQKALQMAKERFNLSRVVLVGDRGMVSDKIIQEIVAAGLSYIVGVRMRSTNAGYYAATQAGRYRTVAANLMVKEVDAGEKDRYIVCLNPLQRAHDREVRKEVVKRLKKALKDGGIKSLVGHRGYRRYVSLDGEAGIDREKLKEDARFDGKWVLRTNTTLSATEVAQAYKGLWRVERAFRELKTGLDLRPVYHWTEKRVRGHIMVCFLAFVLETALRRRLLDAESKARYGNLLRDLGQLQAVEVTMEGRIYRARTELQGDAMEAFRALGLRPPNHWQEVAAAK